MKTSRPRLSAPTLVLATALLGATLAGCGGGGSPNAPGNPNNPGNPGDPGNPGNPSGDVLFDSFQASSIVIGQPDFVTRGGSFVGASATSLYEPYGRAALSGGTLWIPDYSHNRILAFSGIPTSNGAAAQLVLGQADFVSYATSTSATGLKQPQEAVVADGKLLVAEYGNNRVAVWNTIPTTTNAAADLAIGKPSLDVGPTACTSTSLSGPQSLVVADGKLLVADTGHNRILVWNQIPTTSGAPADLVIGQPDFTTCSIGTSESTFRAPTGVWSDGTRVAVVDLMNHRVLIWNVFPTTNGAAADVVLGHTDFVTGSINDGGTTRDFTLNFPTGVESNGRQLYVADRFNNRVLVWNSFPTTSGAPADAVLGQGSFTRGSANDDNQDGLGDLSCTARTLANPTAVKLLGTRILVTDEGNNRVLVFQGH